MSAKAEQRLRNWLTNAMDDAGIRSVPGFRGPRPDRALGRPVYDEKAVRCLFFHNLGRALPKLLLTLFFSSCKTKQQLKKALATLLSKEIASFCFHCK